jgi:hypothetical protein
MIDRAAFPPKPAAVDGPARPIPIVSTRPQSIIVSIKVRRLCSYSRYYCMIIPPAA